MCIYVKHLPDIFVQYISQMYFQDNSNRIVQAESLVRGVEESVGDSRAGVEEELREVGHHQGVDDHHQDGGDQDGDDHHQGGDDHHQDGDDYHQDGDDGDQTDNYIYCHCYFITIVTMVFIIIVIVS